jgi:hypothetical protein
MVAFAFIHPDFETRRVQTFCVHAQLLLIPPVPLSGRQVQLDRFQVIVAGVTAAVNVTESGLARVDGLAAPAQLGDHAGFVESYLPPDGYFQVQSGPNTGVLYFTKVPIEGLSRIRINRTALSFGSDFYFRQPANNAPPGRCLRADVVPFLPLAENHEGLTLSSTSHAGVLKSELKQLVPQSTEHVVALNDLGLLLDKAKLAAEPGINAARQASLDQVNGGTVPAIQYCTFRYF